MERPMPREHDDVTTRPALSPSVFLLCPAVPEQIKGLNGKISKEWQMFDGKPPETTNVSLISFPRFSHESHGNFQHPCERKPNAIGRFNFPLLWVWLFGACNTHTHVSIHQPQRGFRSSFHFSSPFLTFYYELRMLRGLCVMAGLSLTSAVKQKLYMFFFM